MTFVDDKLRQADELAAKSDEGQSQGIWHNIVTLYGGNHELDRRVKYARQRLDSPREKPEHPPYEVPRAPPKEPAKEKQ